MTKDQLIKIIYWLLFAMAVVFLWFSLRTSLYQMEYAFVAILFWAAAYFFNKKFMSK